MRTQWCREHVDQIAQECGLDESTVQEIKKATDFCNENPEFSKCATRAITTLLRVGDANVKTKSIQFAKNVLQRRAPNGGVIKAVFTEPEIKCIISQVASAENMPEPKRKKPTFSQHGFELRAGINYKLKLLSDVLSCGQISVLGQIIKKYGVSDEYAAISLLIKRASERLEAGDEL